MGAFSKRRHFAGHWEMESQPEDEQTPAGIKSLPRFLLWNFQVFLCACHLAVLEGHLFAGRQQMMWKSGTCRLLSELLHLPVLVTPLFAKVKCPYLQNSVINVVEVGALNWVLFEVSQRASALLQQWQENNDSKILWGVFSPEGGNTDWPVSLCRKITDSFAFSI